ncbi:uncharacterized protein V6R79_015115 [Siganus canaliculatus]
MSMLAEPRRKVKWSVDPRNSAWSKDDSKFGQKMLERMGWSKGKGLGRTEQGSTEHIKVKVKNDSYGLGTTANYEDNWIAHQDDFNELLAQLNNHHGQNQSSNNNAEPPADEQKGFSLEEKSKLSKKRVHYMKFTKGKDLSCRTATDLNCIFGKRATAAKDQEQESSSSSSGETEETRTPATSELDSELNSKTVTSTLNMQEYFAQRMAQLKKARGQSTAETTNVSSPSDEPSPIHSSDGDSEEPKKKKKKKKSKKSADEPEAAEESSGAPVVAEEEQDQQQEHQGKKKKKRKMVENEGAANENDGTASGVEQQCEELPPPKKKKKKKLKKDHEDSELQNGLEPTEEQTVESEVAHKKKKKNKHRDEVNTVEEEESVEKKSKKDKKKKKKLQE